MGGFPFTLIWSSIKLTHIIQSIGQSRVSDIIADTRMAAMYRTLAKSCLLTLAGLLVGTAASRSEPQTVTLDLIMMDYRFLPDRLIFEHDVHYRLHLANHGKETHEVTAPLFFSTADIDNPDVLNRERTEIVMQPGEAKDLFLTAHRPGTYDLRCADHDWDGMIGGITVD
jgi:uncharacterized cupredoxin-like copper-binding protein